jgi:hypothetical protein
MSGASTPKEAAYGTDRTKASPTRPTEHKHIHVTVSNGQSYEFFTFGRTSSL